MGTVTAYNLANVQAALGGVNPISMSEYYRGGPFVPTTRTVITRDPTSGEIYNYPSNFWRNYYGAGFSDIYWFSGGPGQIGGGPANITSFTNGGWTYYRGTFRFREATYGIDFYGFWREQSSTAPANTGVPSSGQISLSQLFGASNP